jgi:anti-sigma factor RsiW
MAAITDQLRDNREPVLLLYLANELPPEDRADLERLLSSDASLQRDLDSLRALQTQVVGGLDILESSTVLAASENLSTRRVMREMRRFQLELDSRAPAHLETGRHHAWPRWTYPLAAAAAIIFILLGLWGIGAIDFTPQLPGPGPRKLAEENDSSIMREQLAQESLSDILYASFGGEELDHPIELEETEDPAAFRTNG